MGLLDVLSDAYMRNVGRPFAQLVGGGGRGLLGLDPPEYADSFGMEAYRNAQALSNSPTPLAFAALPAAVVKGAKASKAVKAAPRDEALEVARQNAVKMLGLPENNTAMDRARALGAKQQVADISFELINGPSKYLKDSYALGQKAREVKPDLNEWAYGGYAKELGPFPWQIERGPAWEAFYEAGKRGHDMPPMATGYRYGDVPSRGISWNYRDDIPERGVSMAYVDHPQANEWADAVSKIFIKAQMRPRVEVGGYLNPSHTGADGEPLLVGARKLAEDFRLSSGKGRSRFAAFDPARVNENDLLGAADPTLLAILAAGTAAPVGYGLLTSNKDAKK